MNDWVAIDQRIADCPKTAQFADRLGISIHAAVGALTIMYGAVAAHRPDGTVRGQSPVSPRLLAQWGKWDSADADRFASAWLDLFVDGDRVHDWDDWNGKLLEARNRERDRKRALRAKDKPASADSPQTVPGQSAPTVPDLTGPSLPTKATTTTLAGARAVEVASSSLPSTASSEQVRIIDIRGPPSVDNTKTSTEETPKENTVVHSAMQPACGDTKPAQKDQLAVAASAVSDQRSQRKHPAPREDAFVLPERVPSKPWAEFLAMRVRIKKPLTEEGKGRAVLKLDALAAAGHDRQLVIEQSVDNQWAGLFPLKADAYIAPSRTEKSKPLCVHCGGNGDLMSYDRKPIHARCLDAWQLGQQGAMDSARRAS